LSSASTGDGRHSVSTFAELIFGPGIPVHTFHAFLVSIILIILSFNIFRRIKRSDNYLLPEEGFTLKTFFELIVNFFTNLLTEIMGERGKEYVPFVSSIFIYILFCNLLGLIPGFLPPTIQINTNYGIALFVFLSYNYFGFREHGFRYLKQFTGPLPYIAVLFLPIELISHLFRPFTLSVRLFGNMFGDHQALEIFSELVPIIVPSIFMLLGIVVSLIQAFVFSLLTGIYISFAISHEH